jgi:thiol:disulfide interchange protein DsbD
MNRSRFFVLLVGFSFLNVRCQEPITHQLQWDADGKHGVLTVAFAMDADDALYKEYTHVVCDHEHVQLGDCQTDAEAVMIYDPIFKENKAAYFNTVTMQVPVQVMQPIEQAHVRFTYYTKSIGRIQEHNVTMVPPTHAIVLESVQTAVDAEAEIEHATEDGFVMDETTYDEGESLYCTLSHVIEDTSTVWLRLLLVFLLGMLLSLTPCIYPMIPITVGILQGQGTASFGKNLFVSLCYTAGVATTFACMGLFAAYTGSLFGTALQHPLFVLGLVLLLAYFAGSMVGLYDMYIPRFLQPSNSTARGGSPVAAFIFGALSGTIASPCVSPGLALVLGMVAKLGNPLYGFMLLFAFGTGLSMPLLIIGTFSGSLNLLPKAGMWMVEIKRFFGFVMFGMCIHFLSPILSGFVTALLFTALFAVVGLYYLYVGSKNRTLGMRMLASGIGCVLIAIAVMSAYVAVRALYYPERCAVVGIWTTDYQCAINQARHEHKKLLIKVEAPCCSLCRVINTKFFAQESVQEILQQHYVALVVDGSDTSNPDIKGLIERYAVIGFPTVIIVDADDLSMLQKWTGDVHKFSLKEFEMQLLKFVL